MSALRAVVIAALAASAAAAEPVFRIQPYPDHFIPAVNETIERFRPVDAFLGLPACGVLDTRYVRQPTLEEAEQLLAPCLLALGSRYGVEIAASRLAAASDGSFSTQIEGLVLRVPARLPATHELIRDLNFALNRRGGRVFGHPTVVRRAETPRAANPVQTALERCLKPAVTRRVETGADFIGAYGPCLTAAPGLRIRELRPSPAHRLGIVLVSAAEPAAVRRLNGSVSVFGEDGPVSVLVMAYPVELALP